MLLRELFWLKTDIYYSNFNACCVFLENNDNAEVWKHISMKVFLKVGISTMLLNTTFILFNNNLFLLSNK